MKLRRTCKDVTRLVLERQDRELALAERVSVRLHMWACKTCPTFERQALFMQKAMQRWRRDGDGGA